MFLRCWKSNILFTYNYSGLWFWCTYQTFTFSKGGNILTWFISVPRLLYTYNYNYNFANYYNYDYNNYLQTQTLQLFLQQLQTTLQPIKTISTTSVLQSMYYNYFYHFSSAIYVLQLFLQPQLQLCKQKYFPIKPFLSSKEFLRGTLTETFHESAHEKLCQDLQGIVRICTYSDPSEAYFPLPLTQGCQIFLDTVYQNGEKYTNYHFK
jgi:hypothetical protein